LTDTCSRAYNVSHQTGDNQCPKKAKGIIVEKIKIDLNQLE
jgi:hypothetical protein